MSITDLPLMAFKVAVTSVKRSLLPEPMLHKHAALFLACCFY